MGSFHALMDILHVQDDQETTHASSYESRDTEYILHMARVENEREIVDVGGVGCQVDSRVVVLSLFPVPAAISAIAKSLATRHLLCSNATPNFHGNGDCALTGSICPDCLCIPDDFHVSLLPLEYDALKFNGMAYEIMHSSMPSVQHERLVELYVNPPCKTCVFHSLLMFNILLSQIYFQYQWEVGLGWEEYSQIFPCWKLCGVYPLF